MQTRLKRQDQEENILLSKVMTQTISENIKEQTNYQSPPTTYSPKRKLKQSLRCDITTVNAHCSSSKISEGKQQMFFKGKYCITLSYSVKIALPQTKCTHVPFNRTTVPPHPRVQMQNTAQYEAHHPYATFIKPRKTFLVFQYIRDNEYSYTMQSFFRQPLIKAHQNSTQNIYKNNKANNL